MCFYSVDLLFWIRFFHSSRGIEPMVDLASVITNGFLWALDFQFVNAVCRFSEQ